MIHRVPDKPVAACLAITVIACAASGIAQVRAQGASEAALEEVVVVGTRADLEAAVEFKRASDTIVDAISASDIGKMPDQNIADSLQRVPGVQIQRNRGQAEEITIRGLQGRYTQTLVNGRPITTVFSDSLSNRNFQAYIMPSAFVSRLAVHKSGKADVQEGGIAGSVDIVTQRALEMASGASTSRPTVTGTVTTARSAVTSPRSTRIFLPTTRSVSCWVSISSTRTRACTAIAGGATAGLATRPGTGTSTATGISVIGASSFAIMCCRKTSNSSVTDSPGSPISNGSLPTISRCSARSSTASRIRSRRGNRSATTSRTRGRGPKVSKRSSSTTSSTFPNTTASIHSCRRRRNCRIAMRTCSPDKSRCAFARIRPGAPMSPCRVRRPTTSRLGPGRSPG